MNLKNKIYNIVSNKESLFLVGASDAGKTFFIKNQLIPYLEKKGIVVTYFSNCDKIKKIPTKGLVIVDEVETFLDKEFLEKNNNIEKPYYSESYINKVERWFKNLSNIKISSIYIVTRNNKKELSNFKKNIKKTDWSDKEVKVVLFHR